MKDASPYRVPHGRALTAVLTALAIAAIGVPRPSLAARPDTPPRTVALLVGGHPVTAEVADSEQSRERGLMGRFALPENHGMLFVYPRPRVMTFWMKDTPMPLSIAFVSRQGVILNIEEMAPGTETVHASAGEGMYALEMRRGWFRAHGVMPGARLAGLARVAAAKD